MKIKFKRDTSFRKTLFTADHFAHPAKMDAQLLIWLVEKYTKVGETILDPMAGSGTTMLACTIGRNVILVELEQKFVDMQEANWDKVKMMPQLGYQMGECKILQGDARNLEGIVDGIITSPPYEGTDIKSGVVDRNSQIVRKEATHIQSYVDRIDSIITSPPYQKDAELHGESHEKGREDGCRSRYPYTDRVDSNANKCYNKDICQLEFILELKNIGTPYHKVKGQKELQAGQTCGNINALIVGGKLIDEPFNANPVLNAKECLEENSRKIIKQAFVQIIRECLARGILRNQELRCPLTAGMGCHLKQRLTNAITILLSGKSGERQYSKEIIIPANLVEQNAQRGILSISSHITLKELLNSLNLPSIFPTESPSVIPAISQPDNIGNLKGETYLSAMERVYCSCFAVLKPQGLLILVTKNFIRNKEEVRLDEDTIKLCEQAGFQFVERHYRKLPAQSFWRVIYKQKYPDAPVLDKEDILIFKRKLASMPLLGE